MQERFRGQSLTGFYFVYRIYMFMSSAILTFLSTFVNCFLVFMFSFICLCSQIQTCSFFYVVFRCVFRVHCVLVSRYAVLCLFPACDYSFQIGSFAKSIYRASLMNKIHAMKSHENPNENLI